MVMSPLLPPMKATQSGELETMGEFDDDDGGGDWEWENESAAPPAAPPTAATATSSKQPLLPPSPAFVTSTARIQSVALAAVADDEVVEEEDVVEEVVEEEVEYEMDHEQPVSPAPLSPPSSSVSVVSASTAARDQYSFSSHNSSLRSMDEEKEEVTARLEEPEAPYEVDVEHKVVIQQHRHSHTASWQKEVTAEADLDDTEMDEVDSRLSASAPAPHTATLPPATSLSLNATGDFSVHKHHRSSSIEQTIYDQPALSPQSSFVVQSTSHTTLPNLSALSSLSISALPPAHSSSELDDSEVHVSAIGGLTDRSLLSTDRSVEQKQVDAANDSRFETLSISAIAPSAAEDEEHIDANNSSALSAIDADFTKTSISVSSSATAIATTASKRRNSAVLVEDEAEDTELFAEEESKQSEQPSVLRPASPFITAVADSTTSPTLQLSKPVAMPERPLQQPIAQSPPAHQVMPTSNTTTNHKFTALSRPTVNRSPTPPKSAAVPPVRRQPPMHKPATPHRLVSPQPSPRVVRDAVHNAPSSACHSPAFPFSSPSHIHDSPYAYPTAMPRSAIFVPPSVLPQSHKVRAVQPAAPLRLPPPIAPSAPYLASKQAFLQTIARLQHSRAARQQQVQQQPQQSQHTTSSNPSNPSTAASLHNTLGLNELHQWQLQRHSDERLAQLWKMWQLNGHGRERSVANARREHEEKEDAEMEWLARKEEERRQEERKWQRNNLAHRPATPAAPLHAKTAWQDDDEASEMSSAGSADRPPPSMIQLMESLRVSARHEIALQDSARQGL